MKDKNKPHPRPLIGEADAIVLKIADRLAGLVQLEKPSCLPH